MGKSSDGWAKTKRIGGKNYRFVGTDISDREVERYKENGFSVRRVYSKTFGETAYYIK